MKYTFQVLLKAHDTGERAWYHPAGQRKEFDTSDAALRAGVALYPEYDVRATFCPPRRYEPVSSKSGYAHQVRPTGVSRLLWAAVRGISDAQIWRSKCLRCGLTGQAHWDPSTILTCRRFTS